MRLLSSIQLRPIKSLVGLRLISSIFLISAVAGTYCAQGPNKETVLRKLSQEFRFADRQKNLFEVAREHVLQPGFSEGQLVALRVVPKYLFEESHSDWVEPDSPPTISMAAFSQLLKQAEKIQPIGAFVSMGESTFRNGAFTPQLYQYRNATIRALSYRSSPDSENGLNSFTLWFTHEVTGNITAKPASSLLDPYNPILSIDGRPYLAGSREVLETADVGRRNTFTVGGPVDIVFDK